MAGKREKKDSEGRGGAAYRFRWLGLDYELVLLEILGAGSA